MTKTTVVHHSADYDGIFCREIAKKFLPDAELIGWDFGDPPLGAVRLTTGDKVYVLDLPVDKVFAVGFGAFRSANGMENVIWIDHHKSAIDSHPPFIPGYRIDGVAACRLAWQWFMHCALPDHDGHDLPSKQDFIDRKVIEPEAVRLAGEYDIWDRRDPNAELFQHGLRSKELTERDWQILLGVGSKKTVSEIEAMMDAGHPFDLRPDGTVDESVAWMKSLLRNGECLQYANAKENESIIKAQGFSVFFEGLRFLALNTARCNSFSFTAGLDANHDGCLGFNWAGNHWRVSLYHAPGKEHHDLSKIAVKFGGGGHRGACGFTASKLPWIPCSP